MKDNMEIGYASLSIYLSIYPFIYLFIYRTNSQLRVVADAFRLLKTRQYIEYLRGNFLKKRPKDKTSINVTIKKDK